MGFGFALEYIHWNVSMKISFLFLPSKLARREARALHSRGDFWKALTWVTSTTVPAPRFATSSAQTAVTGIAPSAAWWSSLRTRGNVTGRNLKAVWYWDRVKISTPMVPQHIQADGNGKDQTAAVLSRSEALFL